MRKILFDLGITEFIDDIVDDRCYFETTWNDISLSKEHFEEITNIEYNAVGRLHIRNRISGRYCSSNFQHNEDVVKND